MTDKNYTPMQEVFFQLDVTQNQLEFKAWMKNNIARLLYEEKYLIVDTYDEGNDPYRLFRNQPTEITKGQQFFENHFINL
jgi:hypothetical protein